MAEQPVEHPSDQNEQKTLYSVKNKNHTLKNQLTVLPNGKDIVDVKIGAPGSTSDISQFRAHLSQFCDHQKFKGDKGYIGEKQISTPHKKPNKGELSDQQKQENKEFLANRIYVEHMIRLLKIFRVAQERFRLGKFTHS
ncbi:transposase family protein [Microcoleus sp. F4-D5]